MPRKAVIFLIIFSSALSLYVYTLAPGWGPINIFNTWDGLEYVLCSSAGGVDHPPGHPFYLFITKLFVFIIPFGSVAWRMNLFSAVFGALTAGMVFLIIELALKLIRARGEGEIFDGSAIVAAFTFAVSRVFWTHCLITEVHTLYLFLVCCLLFSALKFIGSKNKFWIYMFSLSGGLLISTSIMNALTVLLPSLILVLFAMFLMKERSSLLDAARALFLFCLGSSFYLYYQFVMARGAAFIHPMNLETPWAIGSIQWFVWFISGKAWTGEGMFSLSRVFLNLPNFTRHMVENFSVFTFGLFVICVVAAALLVIRGFFGKKGNKNSDASENRTTLILLLFLLAYFCAAVPQLSLQDPSNPGSSTYIYVANFFLPSFLIYVIIAGIGIGWLAELAFKKGLIKKAFDLFGAINGQRAGRAALLLVFYCLFALPVYFLAVNYPRCDLKEENTGYHLARAVIRDLPDHSVIYSKLVFELVGAYFERVEPIMGGKDVMIKNPDIITANIRPADASGVTLMIKRTSAIKDMIKEDLSSGRTPFLGGDCIDQDKAPEVLLMSDLNLLPKFPGDFFMEPGRPIPTELLPYEVKGLRVGERVAGVPVLEGRGISNDGNFSGILELLGYIMKNEKAAASGRQKMSLELYWRALSRAGEDLIGVFTVFDQNLRRVDPLATTAFFTLGGEYPSSQWAAGSVVMDTTPYYLPSLPPGGYYLALGMLKGNGDPLPYFPKEMGGAGGAFDYILLLPFSIGGAAPNQP